MEFNPKEWACRCDSYGLFNKPCQHIQSYKPGNPIDPRMYRKDEQSHLRHITIPALCAVILTFALVVFAYQPPPTVGAAPDTKAEKIIKRTPTGLFTRAGYTIEIQSITPIEGGIEVIARAWKNGRPVGFVDGTVEIERFRIYNPPIFVDDPTGTTTVAWTDRSGSYTRKLKEDPREALYQTLAHTVSVVAKDGSKIVPGKVGQTTSTFYPDPNVESTSVDGHAFYDAGSGTFATFRAATANVVSDSAATVQATILATSASTDNYNDMGWGMFLFDTSAIPDTDTISSATISLWPTFVQNEHSANLVIGMTSGSWPASNTAIAAGDYQGAFTNVTTEVITRVSIGSIATGTYQNFALTNLTLLSKTGVSKFGTTDHYVFDNTAPTWVASKTSQLIITSADTADTTSDPKLVVVHAAASTAQPTQDIITFN